MGSRRLVRGVAAKIGSAQSTNISGMLKNTMPFGILS